MGGDVRVDFDITSTGASVTELLYLMRQKNLNYCDNNPTRGAACLDNVFMNIALHPK